MRLLELPILTCVVLDLNHELMVFLYDESEAMHHLKRDFKKDFEDSRLFTMKDMENKPLLTRIKEVLSSLLSPIL